MSDHYYSKTPNVESNPRVWSYKLRDKTFQFKTDHGVFSKSEVDFGSRLLIETFIPPEISGDVLDVGCGYGPIGLSMASIMQDRQVVMIDVNERALELAQTNGELNGINNITVKESDKLAVVKDQQFAAILTNPPIRAGKQTVHSIFEESFECLLPGGELWVVIQKKQGAPSAIEKLSELFAEVDTVVKKKGYFILRAKKD
ncbi:class I SAM-dependent methyltransferase [Cytobacillus sp. FSL W7-1323]|uniref:class I SAM-dependent methyltransferase n=1 Tax=unclassified Cytobacillus TaxID=2675268 RepID=UPI002AFFD96E|nr:class I SAM-dependent methyltransferase [Cytobacillus sp. OWB-43]MEA1855718.1 class I SAM-dependent methyltransferase [Cytobacillus sp. OWB-43]